MTQTEIVIKGYRTAIGAINLASDKTIQLSEEMIMSIATDAAKKIQAQAQAQGHNWRGKLIPSIQPNKQTDDNIVVKMNFYGRFVEGGTKPSGINAKAAPNLISWVKTKFGADTVTARKIAKSIRRKGTVAHWFVKNAMMQFDEKPTVIEYTNKMKT